MKFNILITAFPFVNEYKKLKKFFKNDNFNIKIVKTAQSLKEKDLLKLIKNIDGVICGDDEFNKDVLKKANKLKVLSKWGTGLDSIDLITCKKLNIKVYNTPGAFTESVATQALAFILNFNRKILLNHNNVKNGIWNKPQGSTLINKNIGIIGLGSIGSRISEMLIPFKCEIFGNDIKKINKKKSKLIKNKPLLINIARGPIINEKVLVSLLKKKIITGACLDVFENEPININSKVTKFKNVILTSHNAFNTTEEVNKVHVNTYKNLILGLKNEKFKKKTKNLRE